MIAVILLLAGCFSSFVFGASASGGRDEPHIFAKCWEYSTTPDLRVSPISDETNVYFLDIANKVVGVHLNGGAKAWSADLGGDVISNLLIAGDSILIVTNVAGSSDASAKSVIWSLSRQTGITEWRAEVSPSSSVWLGSSGQSVLMLGSDGNVTSIDSRGAVTWKTELGARLSSEPYFDEVGVAVGTSKNEVVNIAGSDGRVEVLWKSKHAPTALYLNSRTRLIVGDERGNVFSLPVGENPSWRFRNGARISRLLSNSSGYIAISDDNFVYNLSRSGDVKWKRRLPGRVAGPPLMLGDSLVVSILGSGAVYALDLKTGKISNRVETGEDTSAGVGGALDGQGFVMSGPSGLTYFSRSKCPAK